MAHDKVYGICENKCMVEVPSKEYLDDELTRKIVLIATGEEPLTDFEQYVKTKYPDDYRTKTKIPYVETMFGVNFKQMFNLCNAITEVFELHTSNATNMNSMFSGCNALPSIPDLDTSKVTDMGYMFYNCYALTSVPDLDTSKVTKVESMFNGCSSVTSIPDLDLSSVIGNEGFIYNGMFSSCNALTTLRDNPLCGNNVWQFYDNVDFHVSPLDRTSILKVFNGLQTVSGKTIRISSTTNGYLSAADKEIATNKGWTVQVG